MTQEITMGSLFSGSGGFELAGSIFGIRPMVSENREHLPTHSQLQTGTE